MNESFFASKSFTFLVAAAAFLVTAVLISLLYRHVAGHRLRLPRNGRTRPPRLGIVDAFDLDRHRQLVIVRRDNVEHLLMIGGPNDLVIESEIIRSESRELRSLREIKLRDKEFREREPREIPQAPAPGSRAATVEADSPNPLQRRMPPPPSAEEVREAAQIDSFGVSMRVSAPAIDLPAPRPPVFPLPPKRPLAPLPGQRTPAGREPALGSPELARNREAAPSTAAKFSRAPIATPYLQPSARRKVTGAAAQPALAHAAGPGPSSSFQEPVPLAEVEAAAILEPLPAGPALAESGDRGPAENEAAPAPSPPQSTDPLEEEMARLLGRRPG
ncbi:MAG: hypothetical protein L0Y50_04865 [Beijerinckiaceae bacterium]|nr:hypothetical protein [Beijerinckiaceae bacterium]MCI0735591.1 hypothetical protein [Beijerinckiaceae bacterium]